MLYSKFNLILEFNTLNCALNLITINLKIQKHCHNMHFT